MAKPLRPLPVMENITVEHACPLCGEVNRLSLKDIEASDYYKCQNCHGAIPLSPEEVGELRERITHKFADMIRLG
jgi:predicted RNA-binding Zn-ribbon protein involved in translation (DUF1610 family)